MLFSNESVADFINSNFEPVWVSVRPVPLVTVDFGNGTVVKRTLHGNVATYTCSAAGHVLDVLPGIYEPITYVDRLKQCQMLHDKLTGSERPAGLSRALKDYHRRRYEALSGRRQPERVVATGTLRSNTNIPLRSTDHWDALVGDTTINETIRRKVIHKHLMDRGGVGPDQLTRWLYREVLHADLDDPYMGLGNVLFGSYPIAEEDAG